MAQLLWRTASIHHSTPPAEHRHPGFGPPSAPFHSRIEVDPSSSDFSGWHMERRLAAARLALPKKEHNSVISQIPQQSSPAARSSFAPGQHPPATRLAGAADPVGGFYLDPDPDPDPGLFPLASLFLFVQDLSGAEGSADVVAPGKGSWLSSFPLPCPLATIPSHFRRIGFVFRLNSALVRRKSQSTSD